MPPREPHVDFDYDAVEDGVDGGARTDKTKMVTDAEMRTALTTALSEFCHYLIEPRGRIKKDMPSVSEIGQRAIMAMWVMRPEVLNNRTICELADILGVDDSLLSRKAGRFSRRFGIKSPRQWSATARLKLSAHGKKNVERLRQRGFIPAPR